MLPLEDEPDDELLPDDDEDDGFDVAVADGDVVGFAEDVAAGDGEADLNGVSSI